MLYYRIKTSDKLYRRRGYLQTVQNELYTPAEVKRYCIPDEYGCKMCPEWLEPVQISKRKICWFCGARFAA